MSKTTFTISTDTELLNWIKTQTDNVSNYFNDAVKYKKNEYKNRKKTEFMYYIGLPFLGVIGSIAATLYFLSLFFYILTSIISIYLMVFIFLYYDKYYREVKK